MADPELLHTGLNGTKINGYMNVLDFFRNNVV